MTIDAPAGSPFNLDSEEAYLRWREAKLAGYPERVEELLVEVSDPRALTDSEAGALLQRLRKCNMAILAGTTDDNPDKAIPRELGRRFGLVRMDNNFLADDDGITSLTVNPEGEHPNYIPYTNRPIRWHTDGYYNAPEKQIRGLILHCVHPAGEGGENALVDPEIAYILLRDEDPDLIRVLMRPDVMTIPPGTDSLGGTRGAATGPVFSYHAATDSLHMRYTARKRNIRWSPDFTTLDTVMFLERLLDSDLPYCFRARLEPGMGLICNNVLHDRSGFTDTAGSAPRLLYRARFFDRIAGTGIGQVYPHLR
ncbi:TauD/TfdA family dioxygenase [Thioalkalivibrio thiocyanodenitrificans]|uniref:TauD/TfdA family dioxygenase n=1 Tax=Thioalkalivibrio thiocyanodenitrificans TaxID=243063 RepID=UPI0003705955|nr:TauD/TfdA family dioxygenase [Thioalkalivibrio thiocyanodenitrificans]